CFRYKIPRQKNTKFQDEYNAAGTFSRLLYGLNRCMIGSSHWVLPRLWSVAIRLRVVPHLSVAILLSLPASRAEVGAFTGITSRLYALRGFLSTCVNSQ